MKMIITLAAFLPLLAACGKDGAPAAPSALAGQTMAGGVQLSWKDNSSNEDMFMIMSKSGTGAYTQAATVDFNVTTYMDMGLTSGTQYTFMVMAMNKAGQSMGSNEVTVTIP